MICLTLSGDARQFTAWDVPGSGAADIHELEQRTRQELERLFGITATQQAHAWRRARKAIGVYDDADEARAACVGINNEGAQSESTTR